MSSAHRRVVAIGLVLGLLAVLSGCSRSGDSTATDTTTGASGDAARFGLGPGQRPVRLDHRPGVRAGSERLGGLDGRARSRSGRRTGPNVQGVTASAIKLGVISDVGYSGYPGLNQELFDASDVFADWCNSLGGINGHKIEIDKLDAKLTEYKAAISTACSQDFALVGGGGVFDATGQADRLACLLPDFPGYVVSPEARGSDLSVQATNGGSNTAVSFGLANYLDEKFPDSGDAVGYITANVNTTVINKQQYQEAGATLGWKTVYDDQYNAVGEPTWLPFAQGIADKKVKGLYFVGSAVNLAKLLGALAQIDYKLDWVAGPSNIYDPALITEAGDDLDVNNVYINDATTPFQATDVPAIAQYEQLFDTVPAEGPEDGVARAEQLRGLAAVRPVRQGLRRRPHPAVRLRAGQPHHLVRRRRAERPDRPVDPRGADRVLRAGRGHLDRVLDDRLERQRRSVQLRSQERDPAHRLVRHLGEVRVRPEPRQPEVSRIT